MQKPLFCDNLIIQTFTKHAGEWGVHRAALPRSHPCAVISVMPTDSLCDLDSDTSELTGALYREVT